MTAIAVTAHTVAGIFGRVLAIPAVDVTADFFVLGGDSLLATRVLSAIARECGVELTFDDFIHAPTPAGLAQAIAVAPRTAAGEGAR